MGLEALVSVETLLAAVAAYAAYSYVDGRLLSPLKRVAGPWFTSISSVWYNVQLAKGTQLTAVTKLHEKYGPLVRIAPNIVSVGDVDAVRTIHSTHRFSKGPIYEGFHFANADNVFATSDPTFYKTRKRLVAPAFTNMAVSEMEDIILDGGVYSLVRRLDRHADGKQTIDMFKLLSFMTFDAMGEIAFGKSFNLLEEEDHPMLEWMQQTLMLGIYKLAFGPLATPLLFPKEFEGERKMANFALEAIHHRRREGSSRPDSLQKLLDAKDEDTGKHLSDRDIAAETMVQMVAGTDTTSATLTWTLHRLLDHPECMSQLVAELDAAFPNIDARITHADVRDLPYLNAVLHETMRIHPVAAGDAHRVVPPEGAELCGQFLPGGTIVIPQMHVLHHLESHWPEPYAFKPERWLASPDRVQEMKRAFVPFSTGVRACLGRNLAWLELRVALAVMIRCFEFKRVPGPDMTPQHRFIVRPKGGVLNVTVRRRLA